jgi:serine/threonine protein phosphatase PrpC
MDTVGREQWSRCLYCGCQMRRVVVTRSDCEWSGARRHVRKSLCQHILAEVSSRHSSDEVSAIVKSAFSRTDEELKQSLLVLPPNVRMSKGYCNAGSCAVLALFIDSVLYIANVGDCAAVLGKVSKETLGLQAVEVSVDHSCNNPNEAKLVVERSHDRNAIRMSKDDQATGAGIVGVKRVAGSLAMTRAFGDFYLKCPELSSAPFKSKVPYITSEPSVTTVYMDGSEKYVILASDGLWDVMTPQEAVHIVDKFGTLLSTRPSCGAEINVRVCCRPGAGAVLLDGERRAHPRGLREDRPSRRTDDARAHGHAAGARAKTLPRRHHVHCRLHRASERVAAREGEHAQGVTDGQGRQGALYSDIIMLTYST